MLLGLILCTISRFNCSLGVNCEAIKYQKRFISEYKVHALLFDLVKLEVGLC